MIKKPTLLRAILFSALLLSCSLLSPSLFAAEPAATSYPPHAIPGSQLRVLPKNSAGRQYMLHIGLPGNYAKDPAKRYPVVYVTDGYWDFQKITTAHGSLVFDKVVPEFITVGIGYAGENPDYDTLRRWELSPVPYDPAAPDASGHAADFLRTIEMEIIPLIERDYRVDPSFRVLGGASLGGLFTLYAMYTKPHLFQGYMALTPAIVVGNDWILEYDASFAKTRAPLNVRLHVSGGEYEWPDFLAGIRRFDDQMKKRAYPGLAYKFSIIEGERHAGMQLAAYTRALRHVFEPLAPETGIAK
jgi:uncharacterized protein